MGFIVRSTRSTQLGREHKAVEESTFLRRVQATKNFFFFVAPERVYSTQGHRTSFTSSC